MLIGCRDARSSPDERSDIRERFPPHVAALMRATIRYRAQWSTSMDCVKASVAGGLLAVTLSLSFVFAHAQTYVSLGYGGVSCTTWHSRKTIEGTAYEARWPGLVTR